MKKYSTLLVIKEIKSTMILFPIQLIGYNHKDNYKLGENMEKLEAT